VAGGTGTAELDFGAGNELASVAITGLTGILVTDHAEAFFMAEDHLTDHNADEHMIAALGVHLICSKPTAGVGFNITAVSGVGPLTGKYNCRYVWSS
jgi:hypothetical protein